MMSFDMWQKRFYIKIVSQKQLFTNTNKAYEMFGSNRHIKFACLTLLGFVVKKYQQLSLLITEIK